jgi:hypothetical protein
MKGTSNDHRTRMVSHFGRGRPASVLLAMFQSPYWTVLTALVGLDLLQSGLTGWYLVAWLFRRTGLESPAHGRR